MLQIHYGILTHNIDITDIVLQKCGDTTLHIPKGAIMRDSLFTDPIPGTHKYIIIGKNSENMYDENVDVYINRTTNEIRTCTKQKERYAILFFGLTRSLSRTYPSLKENIFDVLCNNNIDYDIFLHTYHIDGAYVNQGSNEKIDNYNNDEYKLLNPKYCIIEKQTDILQNIDFNSYYTKLGIWPGTELRKDTDPAELTKYLIRNMVLALHSKKQITMVLEQHMSEYDYVIILRPDLYIKTKIDPDFIRARLNPNNIIIPKKDSWHGCNDRLCISRPKNAVYYGKLFDQLLPYSRETSIVSERYMKDMLIKKNIKFIKHDINYDTIRAKN